MNERLFFCGGWWVKDFLGRRVIARIKCQCPRWSIYLANVAARRVG